MITFSKDMYSLIQQSTRTRSTGTKPFKGNLEQDRLVWKGGGDRALFLVAAKQENGRGHCARGRRGLRVGFWGNYAIVSIAAVMRLAAASTFAI